MHRSYNCYWIITVTIAILVSGFISFSLLKSDSIVIDEYEHIGAAYAHAYDHYYALNSMHPPLIKLLAGYNLLTLDIPKLTIRRMPKERIAKAYARTLLRESGIKVEQILSSARFPILILNYWMLLSLLFVLKRLVGMPAAAITIIITSFSPIFLGHGHLVTMDVPVALAMAITLAYIVEFLKEKNLLYACMSTLWCSIACLIKYNALLCPVLILTYGLYLLFFQKNSSKHIGAALISIASVSTIITTVSISVIALNSPDAIKITQSVATDEFHIKSNLSTLLSSHEFLTPLAVFAKRLELFTRHIFFAPLSNSYFLGNLTKGGHIMYYPTLFLLKESLIFLFFILIGIYSYIRTSREDLKNSFKIFEWFCIVYILISLSASLQTGLRYIFPLYIPLILLSSIGLARRTKNVFGTSLYILSLPLFFVIHSCCLYPFYLSYFNKGTYLLAPPYKIASDSNIDWGQDNQRLVRYINETFDKPLYVDLVGHLPPEAYIQGNFNRWATEKGPPPQKGIFAISAFKYAWLQAKAKESFAYSKKISWLSEAQPISLPFNSILVFRFDK